MARHVRALVTELRDLLELFPHQGFVARLSLDSGQCKGGLVGQRSLGILLEERRRRLFDGAVRKQQRHRELPLQGRVGVGGLEVPRPIPDPDRAVLLGLSQEPDRLAILGGVAQCSLGEGDGPRRIVLLERFSCVTHVSISLGAEPAHLRRIDPFQEHRRLGACSAPPR